jgi:hypothetical protein
VSLCFQRIANGRGRACQALAVDASKAHGNSYK